MAIIRGSAFVSSLPSGRIGAQRSSWLCANSKQDVRTSILQTRRLQKSTSVQRVHMQKESATSLDVVTESVGEVSTTSYRLAFKSLSGNLMSPWHDLPLYPTNEKNIVTFINEIPRGQQAKMEIATDEEHNPIKQDIKKGQLRFYKYGPSLVNYGAIPRTWEDPGNLNPELNVCGDGDPLDVTEIGAQVMPFGAVYPVKVLGTLALLDEGEVDWKIIAINVNDPMAEMINNVSDVEKLLPGRISEVREWFRLYKTAEGKGENEYGYGGEAKGVDFALQVIEEAHQSWLDLRSGKIDNEDGLSLK